MFVRSDMGEPLGLLQVTVIRGKKLVIRDFKSSDPYVIVKLGTEVCLVIITRRTRCPDQLQALLCSFFYAEVKWFLRILLM